MPRPKSVDDRDLASRRRRRPFPISIETFVPYLVNRVAVAALRGESGEFERHGLTVPQYRILLATGEHEYLHFRELAELTSIERPTLSRLLDEMEEAGLLRRRRDLHDSRSVNIALTPVGQARLDGTMSWANDIEREFFEGISKADVAVTRRVLVRLFDNINKRHGRLHKQAGKRRAPE